MAVEECSALRAELIAFQEQVFYRVLYFLNVNLSVDLYETFPPLY